MLQLPNVGRPLLLRLWRSMPLNKTDDYQNTGAQFRDPLGSSHASPFKLIGSHSFPNNAFILTVGTWQCWEFKSGCTLASHRMRFYIWFSANLVLQLLYIKVSFRVYIETFKLFLWCLSWECKFLNTSFSFTTLSRDSKRKQLASLCSFACKKMFLRIMYSHSALGR